MSRVKRIILNVNRVDAVLTAFLLGMALFAVLFCLSAQAYSNNIQEEIASEVIRLHVLANSDSPEDQTVKFMVREAVLNVLEDRLNGNRDIETARVVIESCLDELETAAGLFTDLPVNVELCESYFPTRTYRGATLPAGVYETLRVSIGNAEGRNWWCVVFPPLCLIELVTQETVTEGAALKNVLSDEAYNVVTRPETVKVKFKAVEIWQEIKNLFTKNS